MDDRDPWAVLGLPLDATRDQAQRAFRRLAKQTHPDAGGEAADFRVVAAAWAELAPLLPSDPRPVPVSPHRQAYRQVDRPATSRVIWAEPRRPVGHDFAAVLEAEMARVAA